jgi:ssDNA-binding Zn-finger/Zn-ribbon topoisomerase 1
MAEKKAKTAQKGSVAVHRHVCPNCGSDSRVTYFTGFGPKGLFWVCEKACGYKSRTR